jgi:hypothetical protein
MFRRLFPTPRQARQDASFGFPHAREPPGLGFVLN